MRSYDIDGVITAGIIPQQPCIIVSGRVASLMPETRAQFRKLGVPSEIPVYLRPAGEPADRVAAALWKAMIISLAGVTEHWEDDPVQIAIIRAACPATNVVHVK